MNFKIYLILIKFGCLLAVESEESSVEMVPIRRTGFVKGFIVGGKDAKPEQFPFVVSLIYTDYQTGYKGHNCGGIILNENWIITAAHCFVFVHDGIYEALAGQIDFRIESEFTQKRKIIEKIIHPRYNKEAILSPHDIALGGLESKFLYNPGIQPIRLTKFGHIPRGKAILAGWGSTSNTTDVVLPYTLQYVKLPIMSLRDCFEVLTNTSFHWTNICTGPLHGGAASCGGDSGAGLIQYSNNNKRVYLLGTVSWGWFPCAQPYQPTIFVRTSAYVDWIRENTANMPNSKIN
uniref:Putative trypsin-like serine protease n=1 Tax=Corethrella appendiculata TaxID=1370023 RepID=U5EYF7_9DIPT